MLKFITFDLWETVIADSPELDSQRTKYRVGNTHTFLSKKHPAIAIERIFAAHKKTWQECSALWGKARDMAFPDQVRLFVGLIDESLLISLKQSEIQSISEIYAGAVLQFPPRLIEGARETLTHLSISGYKLGLICNTGRTPGFMLRKLLESHDILKYFDSVLFSDETIVRKPDAGIFEKSLRELQADKRQTVHVGDSWENDILGAQAAGIKTVWISPESQNQADCPVIKSIVELPEVLDKI
ncbi:MAG: HAD family hydrolase [Candidatus Edwardsbacteria bacterium]|nr:HAD family hydrolase [Candidatus Edwardsbacteria bacterium]MBU1575603.1 HAD family hydrolase [Candidatus Edwardsbacteria bacterium]MBU2462647.1 HAD family hydrolase [Candidatus Edwardsbacteria bacterium]MBU2594430.1 HAD family hydrolase [Candidatus Edwardsbacteria bacterium]